MNSHNKNHLHPVFLLQYISHWLKTEDDMILDLDDLKYRIVQLCR